MLFLVGSNSVLWISQTLKNSRLKMQRRLIRTVTESLPIDLPAVTGSLQRERRNSAVGIHYAGFANGL
jgi:hypothetical protein